jgi:DMSO/TMAO reductase YedYZ heme-binding membrane subunit
LIQVLLMSRLPPLEHAFGRDRLARIHRVVGLLSFWLMITHIVLIIAGYASGQWAEVVSTIWDLITNYGRMLLAVAGTACLVMVVVTSVKAARRRLRYESWHLLHLYGYLGVGLALPHQLWTGQEFLQSPAATVYWWTLWAVAAATILVWRIWLPLWRSARYRLRVAGVVRESSDVVSVYLTGRRLDRLPLRAGQFINVRFLSRPGWTRANPFSLSMAPNGHTLRISAKAFGEGSARLGHLRPGTRVLFEGRTAALAAGRGLSARSFSPAPVSASHHCARWQRASSTRLVRRSCCSATPPSRSSRVSWRCSRQRGACTFCTCRVRGARQARSSGRRRTGCLSSSRSDGGSPTWSNVTSFCAARAHGRRALTASFEAPAHQLTVSIPKALGGEINETNRHLAGLDDHRCRAALRLPHLDR